MDRIERRDVAVPVRSRKGVQDAMKRLAIVALGLLAGCNAQDHAGSPPGELMANAILPDSVGTIAEVPAAAPAPRPTDAWIGKWVGVEGLALEIAPKGDAGLYALKVNLLDGADDYEGRADGDVIRFTRDGAPETIRKASGAETGLKYLAEKKDCLVIKSGEGFCRD